jgi:hypothetical protein
MDLREKGVIAAHPLLHVMQETSVSMQWTACTYERVDLSRSFQNECLGADFQFAVGPEDVN